MDHLRDVVRLELGGEVVEREGEAAVDDLPRAGGALLGGKAGAEGDPVQRAAEAHRGEDAAGLVDHGERDAAPVELPLARGAVEPPVAQRRLAGGDEEPVGHRAGNAEARARLGRDAGKPCGDEAPESQAKQRLHA